MEIVVHWVGLIGVAVVLVWLGCRVFEYQGVTTLHAWFEYREQIAREPSLAEDPIVGSLQEKLEESRLAVDGDLSARRGRLERERDDVLLRLRQSASGSDSSADYCQLGRILRELRVIDRREFLEREGSLTCVTRLRSYEGNERTGPGAGPSEYSDLKWDTLARMLGPEPDVVMTPSAEQPLEVSDQEIGRLAAKALISNASVQP